MGKSNDTGTLVLIAVLVGGIYLLYRSLQNLSSTVTGIGTTTTGAIASAYNTLGTEANNVAGIPSSLFTSLGGLGTSAFKSGTSFGTSLGNLFTGTTDTSSSLGNELSSANLGWPDVGSYLGSDYSLGSGSLGDTSIPGLNLNLGPSLLASPNMTLQPLPDSSGYANGDPTANYVAPTSNSDYFDVLGSVDPSGSGSSTFTSGSGFY